MYKKAWCTCKVVLLLIKPIVFLTFLLPSASLDLKVPIKSEGAVTIFSKFSRQVHCNIVGILLLTAPSHSL